MNSSLSAHEMMGLLSEGTDGNKFIKLLHPRHLGDAALIRKINPMTEWENSDLNVSLRKENEEKRSLHVEVRQESYNYELGILRVMKA